MSAKNTRVAQQDNLLKIPEFKEFLEIQVEYGITQRGGVSLFNKNETHLARIVSNVNLFTTGELKGLAFENFISSN